MHRTVFYLFLRGCSPCEQGLKLHLKELKAAYKSAAEAAREEHGRDEGKHESAEILTKARGSRNQSQRSSTVHFLRRQLTMGSLGLEDQPCVNELETTFGATLDYQVTLAIQDWVVKRRGGCLRFSIAGGNALRVSFGFGSGRPSS